MTTADTAAHALLTAGFRVSPRTEPDGSTTLTAKLRIRMRFRDALLMAFVLWLFGVPTAAAAFAAALALLLVPRLSSCVVRCWIPRSNTFLGSLRVTPRDVVITYRDRDESEDTARASNAVRYALPPGSALHDMNHTAFRVLREGRDR